MKKREYRKALVAGAFAGMVLTGSGAYAQSADAANSPVIEKAVRKSKRLEDLKHRRDDKKVKRFDQERRETLKEMRSELRTALEKNDYHGFKTLMADHPKAQKITSDQFSTISKAYRLMKDGKKQEAKELLKTLKLQKSVRGMVIGFSGFDHLTK